MPLSRPQGAEEGGMSVCEGLVGGKLKEVQSMKPIVMPTPHPTLSPTLLPTPDTHLQAACPFWDLFTAKSHPGESMNAANRYNT